MRLLALLLPALLGASPVPVGEGGVRAPGAGLVLVVPEGRHVLSDGVFDDGEWDDAAALRLGGVELLAKRDPRYLFLALRFVDGKHSGLDLYLAAAPEVRRLFHVSSELGTKRFEEGSWTDFDWNVRGWVGNPVGYNHDSEHLVIHEPDGFELQLSRAMLAAEGLGGSTLRLAFRLKRPEVEVPEGAEAAELGEWIVLELAGGSASTASPATKGGKRTLKEGGVADGTAAAREEAPGLRGHPLRHELDADGLHRRHGLRPREGRRGLVPGAHLA